MSKIEDLRRYRRMSFLKVGMRVEYLYGWNDKTRSNFGKVTGARGDKVTIKMDDRKTSDIFHPKFMLRYFDKEGNVIKEYKD